ncbi:MAG TPA: hypothetical protein VNN19_04720, partial [bacterium]|nr:hypothetical protein [bacterium]
RLLPPRLLGLEGETVGVLGLTIGALLLLAVPFLDVWARQERAHPAVTAAGVLALLFVIGMSLMAWAVPP